MEVMALTLPEVVLTPSDIPSADLKELFQTHTIPALKWWLQCRGISVSASSNKEFVIITNCIHQACTYIEIAPRNQKFSGIVMLVFTPGRGLQVKI